MTGSHAKRFRRFFQTIFFLFSILLTFGCTHQHSFSRVERELTLKDHSAPDSILSDVLFFDGKVLLPSRVEGNAVYPYEWDSLLSISERRIGSEIFISDSVYLTVIKTHTVPITNDSISLSEYLAIFKTSIGEIDDYGIFVANLGTVYYRSYHSRKTMELSSAISPNIRWINRENIETIKSYILDSIINRVQFPASSDEEEIGEQIQLRTNGFKASGPSSVEHTSVDYFQRR